MKKWFLVLLFFCCAHSAGASSLDLSQKITTPLGQLAMYTQEAGERWSVQQAREAYAAGAFRSSSSAILSLGVGVRPVWYRLEVDNPGKQPLSRLLSIETAWLDHIEAYFLIPGQDSEPQLAGERLPFAARPIAGRFFAFEHVFAPGRSEVYLRIDSNDPMVIPVYISDLESYYQHERSEGYIYGFIYGVILALMGYNLMLFLSLRVWRYFYFALYLAAFVLMNMSYTGHAYQWLWPNTPHWQQWANHLLIMLFPMTGLVFATIFLNTRRYFPCLHRLVIYTSALFAALEVMAIVADAQALALDITFVFVLIFSIYMISMGVRSVLAGNKSAKYFLIATITHVSGTTITTMTTWGWLPYSLIGYHAVEIGMMLDAILLAMALADQFRLTQQEKLRAERLAKLDPLTGVNNRRAFFDLVAPVWQQAMENGHDMSVVLLDIDRFKEVNDTHGHSSGDMALAEIAKTLTRCTRTTDILARWGGEEFVVLLTHTPQAAALLIAERMRQEIARIQIPVAGKALALTASLGVAHTSNVGSSLEELVNEADRYLYEAKHLGRNRVYPAQAIA